MGCHVSKEATAVVSPLHSPAGRKPVVETPYVAEEKQQEQPTIQQPIKPSPTPYVAPIITTAPTQTTSSSDPNTPEPATPDPAADGTSKPHKHHHHKHKRENSVTAASSKQNSPALLAVQPSRASLSNSTPGHTRKLSGHHRNRSASNADSAAPRTSFNQPDSGNDKKDQGMANHMKMRPPITEETEKPTRALTRSVAESDGNGIDDADQTGEKREKKHREHKDKDKEKGDHKERKKKEKLIKTLELADLQHLSSTNLEALWKQYDKDKNGTLDRKELKRLAKDCIGRTIAMCENEIRLQQPKLTDNELKAAVEKELKFVLPGAAKENGKKEDVQKEMVRRLIRKLDVNGDGDVTKAELLATWNVFAKELFQMKTAEGPVGCSIM